MPFPLCNIELNAFVRFSFTRLEWYCMLHPYVSVAVIIAYTCQRARSSQKPLVASHTRTCITLTGR